MKQLITYTFLSIFCCTAAFAGSHQEILEELDNLQELSIDFEKDYGSKENRVEARKTLENLIDAIDRAVPRLSPDEREWVKAEIRKSGSAAERALRSPEYALMELNDWMDECSTKFQQIKSYQEGDDPYNYELAGWISLRECMYFEEVFDYAYQSEMPGLAPGMTSAQFFSRVFVFESVVRGYLANEMGWTYVPQL
ncbi:hypothetical protein [Ruegeria arenilitoris]|uniref:hypothetical protein n=1 Tax=Ruegeria arenilitoris TaxID=1173585 RepID=UPI00147E4318|nr:hypothetical protein [Ruegeria arenilitoris]